MLLASFWCAGECINHRWAYPPAFFLPSPSGHHSAWSRVPCAVRVVISYLFYNSLHTISTAYMCQSQSPSSSLVTTLRNIKTLICLLFLRETIWLKQKASKMARQIHEFCFAFLHYRLFCFLNVLRPEESTKWRQFFFFFLTLGQKRPWGLIWDNHSVYWSLMHI